MGEESGKNSRDEDRVAWQGTAGQGRAEQSSVPLYDYYSDASERATEVHKSEHHPLPPTSSQQRIFPACPSESLGELESHIPVIL